MESAVDRGDGGLIEATEVGVEYMVSPALDIGAAYTYADNNTDLNENLGTVDIEGNLYSVYATAFWDGKYLDVVYSYGDFENDISRNTGAGLVSGSPDSDSHTFSINAGHNFEFCGVITGPTLGFDYTESEVESYSEVGGGLGALNYQARKYYSSISSVGWQMSKHFCVDNGTLMLQGFTSWEHEFEPEGGVIQASLANLPAGFVLNQNDSGPGTDWMVIGAGARFASHSGWALDVDYQTQLFRDDVEAHYVGAKVSAEF